MKRKKRYPFSTRINSICSLFDNLFSLWESFPSSITNRVVQSPNQEPKRPIRDQVRQNLSLLTQSEFLFFSLKLTLWMVIGWILYCDRGVGKWILRLMKGFFPEISSDVSPSKEPVQQKGSSCLSSLFSYWMNPVEKVVFFFFFWENDMLIRKEDERTESTKRTKALSTTKELSSVCVIDHPLQV